MGQPPYQATQLHLQLALDGIGHLVRRAQTTGHLPLVRERLLAPRPGPVIAPALCAEHARSAGHDAAKPPPPAATAVADAAAVLAATPSPAPRIAIALALAAAAPTLRRMARRSALPPPPPFCPRARGPLHADRGGRRTHAQRGAALAQAGALIDAHMRPKRDAGACLEHIRKGAEKRFEKDLNLIKNL
eukprot:scaffold731_cov328-Prasinococcus_capsulatus_cf.AAC.1